MVNNGITNHSESNNRGRLLRPINFVAKSKSASFETPAPACEASALTTELIAPKQSYFNRKNQLCKMRALASSHKFRS